MTNQTKPRKPYKSLERHYTVEEVCNVLKKRYGLLKQSAEYLGCSRMTLHRYIQKHPEVKEFVLYLRDDPVDKSFETIIRVASGDYGATVSEMLDAAKFVCSTLGKHRGFTTKVETEHSGKLDLPGFTFREKRPEDQQ